MCGWIDIANLVRQLSSGLARRAAWALLILIHVVPLAATTSKLVASHAPDRPWFSCLALWLACGFFSLKLVDVRWLRWRWRRSGMLAFGLAFMLVHHDVAPGVLERAAAAQGPAAVGAALAFEFILRAARLLPSLQDRLGGRRVMLVPALVGLSGSADCADLERQRALPALRPRAPPPPPR